jgi:ATP-dependent DNA helicase PIF1
MNQDFSLELDAPLEKHERCHFPATHQQGKRLSDFSEYLRKRDPSLQVSTQIKRDISYETSEGVKDVIAALNDNCRLIFVSGRAGTGKSRLIDYMKILPGGDRQVVVAPTGVAALALQAATIHSFFKLPIGVVDAEALYEEDVKLGAAVRHMDRLVIDEISMVRADVLDAIDARLRRARADARPFGGVQVVVVGDFLQLPPVVGHEDREILERLGYETPFAFSSKVMQRTPMQVATLKKVWRQSDPDMIQALGWIREGRNVTQAIAWLNENCSGQHRSSAEPLLLTATRSSADTYNRQGIEDLRRSKSMGPPPVEVEFIAQSSGIFCADENSLPAPRHLRLFKGVRVMAVKNDPEQRYVNGSLGVVADVHPGKGGLEEGSVSVLFDGAEHPVRVCTSEWRRTYQDWDIGGQRIVEKTVGEYRQIPLALGFAITIHKSQGLSLDDVRIDLGGGAFAPGQLYVALSRARSLKGLSLARPIEERDVRVDEMLVRFLQWARQAPHLSIR